MRLRYQLAGGGAIVLRVPGEEDGGLIEDLHICRLGMKFLCGTPLPEFMEYAFGLGLEGAGSVGEDPVEFHGVVVQSEPDEERGWRVAIHFCGVGEADAERIDRYSAMAHLRCESCGGWA